MNGINVVLCGDRDQFEGASIAWGTKVEKNHVIVSLPQHASVTDSIRRMGVFTVSVLSCGQADIARQYGGKMQSDQRDIDVSALDFTQWGTPVVKNSCAQVHCEVRQMLDIEEQELVIAKILDVAAGEDLDPLVYDHDSYFHG